MPHNDKLKQSAIEFAKKNKDKIALELTDISNYPSDNKPISIFMAGSPGAGKTEYSKNLIASNIRNGKIIRIDGDEMRSRIPGYTGSNSSLFQGAISILVEKIQDIALANKQSFLLDGTFANYEKAEHNIERSLKRRRQVIIFYVYQDPIIAWKFTQARELLEGRNIPKDSFITQFINAWDTILRLREKFKLPEVTIFLIKKNFETNKVEKITHFSHAASGIDHHFGNRYTKEDLEKIL